MNVAVLLPTIYRPDGLKRTLDSLMTTMTDVIIIAEQDDYDATNIALDYMIRFCRTEKALRGPAYAWNTGLKRFPNYDAYVLANDDDEYMPGWLDEVLGYQLLGDCGLVGLNDDTGKYERAGFCTHYFMTRDFIINYNGGVVACPHYITDFVDVELMERGKKHNQFIYAQHAIVRHHWREIDDKAYQRADLRRKEAKKIFDDRKSNDFPNDWEPVIK